MQNMDRFDRFDVIKALGRGGFGSVCLAYDKVLKCRVAVKLILDDMGSQTANREIEISNALLEYPMISSVLHSWHEEGPGGGTALVFKPMKQDLYSYIQGVAMVVLDDVRYVILQLLEAIRHCTRHHASRC